MASDEPIGIKAVLMTEAERFVDETAKWLHAGPHPLVRWLEEEDARLKSQMLQDGTLIKLNDKGSSELPTSSFAPVDVARTEHLTYICSRRS